MDISLPGKSHLKVKKKPPIILHYPFVGEGHLEMSFLDTFPVFCLCFEEYNPSSAASE